MKDGKIDSLRIAKENFGQPMKFRFNPDIETMEFLSCRMPDNIMPEMEITYLATYRSRDFITPSALDDPLEIFDRELMVVSVGDYIPNADQWLFLFSAPYKNVLFHVFERVQ